MIVGYVQWLRTVLSTRGMCTRHLAENFTLLAAAMPSAAAQATDYLEQARAALTYAAARTGWVDVLQYHLSYLADALALERDELFVEYVEWTAAFDERRGIKRANAGCVERFGAGNRLASGRRTRSGSEDARGCRRPCRRSSLSAYP
jgi:hypothetical protein